jgi:hypothetical protein
VTSGVVLDRADPAATVRPLLAPKIDGLAATPKWQK